MRTIAILICTLGLWSTIKAQDTLYYFKSESNGLVGVRNNKGKVIVEPIFPESNTQRVDKPILTKTIAFYHLPKGQKPDYSKVAVAFGSVYSREGEFLYHPRYIDNGPDYWHEGVRRYVENGKVGLVDENGRRITPAKWDDILPFDEHGYAQVFLGNLKKTVKNGSEYPTVTGDTSSYFINIKGQRIIPQSNKK